MTPYILELTEDEFDILYAVVRYSQKQWKEKELGKVKEKMDKIHWNRGVIIDTPRP